MLVAANYVKGTRRDGRWYFLMSYHLRRAQTRIQMGFYKKEEQNLSQYKNVPDYEPKENLNIHTCS